MSDPNVLSRPRAEGSPGRSVLFLGKAQDEHVQKALKLCRAKFPECTAYLGQWGDPLPKDVAGWQGEYLISYLSRWVIPAWLLQRASVAAINFHPASPEYPGIGCNNFALYENAQEYGVTCHHMAPQVDTGAIIAVKRFPVFPTDTVATLLARTYDYQLGLFCEIVSGIHQGRPLPVSAERWSRKPFTRKQFNELGRIRPEMTQEEIARRVRAVQFGPWKPYVELQGFCFELKS